MKKIKTVQVFAEDFKPFISFDVKLLSGLMPMVGQMLTLPDGCLLVQEVAIDLTEGAINIYIDNKNSDFY